MSEFWNNNNLACVKTWIHLMVLHQYKKVFKDAGSLKMSELQFWNASSSSDLREIQAKTLCHQLDNMFLSFDKAKYEEGSSLETALTQMKAVFIDENKTVADLAEVVDKNYFFLGEQINETT